MINPPTTAASVWAVLVSLLKEATRPLENSLAIPPLFWLWSFSCKFSVSLILRPLWMLLLVICGWWWWGWFRWSPYELLGWGWYNLCRLDVLLTFLSHFWGPVDIELVPTLGELIKDAGLPAGVLFIGMLRDDDVPLNRGDFPHSRVGPKLPLPVTNLSPVLPDLLDRPPEQSPVSSTVHTRGVLLLKGDKPRWDSRGSPSLSEEIKRKETIGIINCSFLLWINFGTK